MRFSESTDHVNNKLMYQSVRKTSTIRDYSPICYQTQRSNQSSECLRSKSNINLSVTILLKQHTPTTRDIIIYGENPRWANNLCVIGEAAVVKEGKDGKTGAIAASL